MALTAASAKEHVWFDKAVYDRAECLHYERLAKGSQQTTCSVSFASGSLAEEVAKARQHIKQSLQCMDGKVPCTGSNSSDLAARLGVVEKENANLKNIVQELKAVISSLDGRVKELEEAKKNSWPSMQICPPKPPSPTPVKSAKEEDEDEGEDAMAAKIREERLAAYAAKKAKKPPVIAKSNIILDVKPWDDETDMAEMEVVVRSIKCDGLLWGAAKLVPMAYGISKLQISCVIEDDKVSADWLTEQIEERQDYVQSVDIAAFNKI